MTATQRAFFIWWKDLERWVTPNQLFSPKNLPEDWSLVRIGEVVKQISSQVRVQKDQEYKMIGVKWYGEGTFNRETVLGQSISARYLTPAVPNAFIYNRLFAWKESFAVVPLEHGDCLVSNEFPQFIVDPERILSRYLYLFFTLDNTIRAVNASSIGSAAVSRNRFKEEYFLEFEIPLPPIAIQRAIVDRWQTAQAEIKAADQRVEELKASIDAQFFKNLGLTPPVPTEYPKVFAVWWEDFLRWSVSYNQATQSGEDITQGSYPVLELDEILEAVQYGTSEKANSDEQGIPVIRMNNLVDGLLNVSNLKYIQLPEKVKNNLVLKYGDILFNRTNSKELVGKCAVFKLEDEYIFASYLIRVKIDGTKAIPDFIAYVINSRIGRQQIDGIYILNSPVLKY